MTKTLQKLRFGFIVLGRALKILFRFRKDIRLLQLNYAENHIFENSFQPVSYRFQNALWYKFDGRNTLEKELKIFNLPNAPKEFNLVVFGLFQKRTYRIKLNPTLRFDSHTFHVQAAFFDVEFLSMQIIQLPIEIKPTTPLFKIHELKVEVHIPDISLQFTPYNQNGLI
ncbi:MAG: hypothetical protein EOO50_00595 [Flavobacterium sp.]|uniref:hypothetical protein n=1 Tax=Flavobacterium sp. TaxID=239 RepID=UPI00120C8489|nr:hypothetical protein [Flavobacterium sp.]RZJ68710.1 MAG: hypothetical protein EOO50_00595 [Flavobacterium sp.]